jgi:hypothetical protein
VLAAFDGRFLERGIIPFIEEHRSSPRTLDGEAHDCDVRAVAWLRHVYALFW